MTDQPPLRDLVEAMLCTVDDFGPDADTLTTHFAALRAALAARPEPERIRDLKSALDDAIERWKLVVGRMEQESQ